MTDPNAVCANPKCGHEGFMHPRVNSGNRFCHVDGCYCDEYLSTEPAPEKICEHVSEGVACTICYPPAEPEQSLEGVIAAVKAMWKTAKCNAVKMQGEHGVLTGETRYIITTQHPRDLSGLMDTAEAAWRDALRKMEAAEVEDPRWLSYPCPTCKAAANELCENGASCMQRVLLAAEGEAKPQPPAGFVSSHEVEPPRGVMVVWYAGRETTATYGHESYGWYDSKSGTELSGCHYFKPPIRTPKHIHQGGVSTCELKYPVATPTAPPEVVEGLPYPTLYYPASTEDWRNPYDGKGMYFATQADAYIQSIEVSHAQAKTALAAVEEELSIAKSAIHVQEMQMDAALKEWKTAEVEVARLREVLTTIRNHTHDAGAKLTAIDALASPAQKDGE